MCFLYTFLPDIVSAVKKVLQSVHLLTGLKAWGCAITLMELIQALSKQGPVIYHQYLQSMLVRR